MNEEITQVQDTVLGKNTEIYDENKFMDGTSPGTTIPLCEAMEEMSYILDAEQVPDADVQLHINIARRVLSLAHCLLFEHYQC